MFKVDVGVQIVDQGVPVIGQVILVLLFALLDKVAGTIVIASRSVGNLPCGSSSLVSASAKQR